jgi:outer membrane biosynthesis protein TonB
MQKSYLVKSPVNFADFGFFVKVGDILVHNPSHANQLTVYRNGEAVRTVQQTTLGIAAFIKTGMIVEVTQQAKKPPVKPVEPAKPAPKPKLEPKPEPKKEAPKPAPKPEPKPEPKKAEVEDEN